MKTKNVLQWYLSDVEQTNSHRCCGTYDRVHDMGMVTVTVPKQSCKQTFRICSM